MDESTTTEVPVEPGGQTIQGIPVDDQGQAIPQPKPAEPTEAENAPEPTETPQEAPSTDDNAEWLKTKGIDLSTPEGQAKLAQSYRELEKGYHQKAQRASELEKTATEGFEEAVSQDVTQGTIDADDPRIAIKRLEIKQNVRDFFDANPEAKEYEKEMAKIVVEKPYLRDDLEALYAVALKNNVSALKSEGGKEALESLAAKQSATAPKGSATNGASFSTDTKITQANVAQMVRDHDHKWYEKHLPEINAAIAGK